MGIQGEFKEFIVTGSSPSWATGKYPFAYTYETIHSLTNPPPVTAVYAGSANVDYVPDGSGSWHTIQVVSQVTFTVLSGSMTGAVGVAIPVGTILRGQFQKMRFSAGSVIAYIGSEIQ